MDDSLERFVHDALAKGISRGEIEETLRSAKWPQDEIQSALDLFADSDFPIPVPRPKLYLSAREAFIYLVLFTMLYLSAWSLGSILFQFINYFLPDPARSSHGLYFSVTGLRWSIATLLIAFPGYLILSRLSYSAARRDPEKRKSKVRKWLTYLTLFIAASVLLGDLISLVFNLLEGELTSRFLLKTLTVAAIAGSIFSYYFWDLKQDDLESQELPPRHLGLRIFGACVTCAVVAAIIGGLYLAGSPGSARSAALDDQRERQLASIATGIDDFWSRNDRLPTDLDELQRTRGIRVQSIDDPDTGEAYGYSIKSEAGYELCADFEAKSRKESDRPSWAQAHGSVTRFWEHDAGTTCFEIEAKGEPE